MSFYFYIKSEKEITYRQLTNKLKYENIEFDVIENLDEFIGENYNKLFIKNKSTRGVNLNYKEQKYSIGLNVISSKTDFEIGLNIVEAISELTKAEILPEDKVTPIDLNSFRNNYGSQWIENEKYTGVKIIMDKIGNEGDTIAIGCCYMTYFIGPNIHKELDNSSEKLYYNGLVNYITRTQFWDREKYITPSIIEITKKGTNETKQIILLYPNGNQFLSKAAILEISNGEASVEIPYEKIKKIASKKFNLVDEEQFLVEQLTYEEYNNIYLQAKEIVNEKNIENTIELNSEIKIQKKWWEFWK
jgi:hypothetical protein